jgi:hypothetical protein
MKKPLAFSSCVSLGLVASLLAGLALAVQPLPVAQAAAQADLYGPPGSVAFGTQVVALPNGNIVITDPKYSPNGKTNIGAVYLYNGRTRALISALTGSTAGDSVGNWGVTALPNGNFLVTSFTWNNGAAPRAGALTWCSGVTGCAGVVSAANSLVGQTASDQVGYGGVIGLSNGNYVVLSPNWDNGAAAEAGAVTWCSGVTGCTGVVTTTNSLVGDTAGDGAWGSVAALPNGNYVVLNPYWNNGAATQVGAITWCSGITGCTGVVTTANSLVGNTIDDQVGGYGVAVLSNGNYVVSSANWDNGAAADAGAVTWGNGATGITGVVTITNSLVGGTAGDQVGLHKSVTVLTNGNYVVSSGSWGNGTMAHVGAVTWGNGATGITGVVTLTNSLVGTTVDDYVGGYVTALSNGNYVVDSPNWSNGYAPPAGAVTWGNGATGITGTVSIANSLVGGITGSYGLGYCDLDYCKSAVTALSNGNYVVASPYWSIDQSDAFALGAVTWGNGATGTTGAVSAANSLVGTYANEQVGKGGVTALANGNYVVRNLYWGSGVVAMAGAATWGSGATGVTGTVSAANSLVGSTTGDGVGSGGITALTNGNYVVSSYYWSNGTLQTVGAVTWGDGTHGITGAVSTTNSLVGGMLGDMIGLNGTVALSDGNYVTGSKYWDNGTAGQAGAITWGNGALGTIGVASTTNSLAGTATDDQVGFSGVIVLSNGNYVVRSPLCSNGALSEAGAITLGYGSGGPTGPVSGANSVQGRVAGGGHGFGYGFPFVYDYANNQLVVSRFAENIVTFFAAQGLGVLGNGWRIDSGSTAPSLANGTDFSAVMVGQALTHTFTLSNTRQAEVTLTGDPLVQIDGPASADFSVVASPTTPILAHAATPFQVRFTPSITGTRAVTVTILSDEAGVDVYTFVLQGIGVLPEAYLPLVQR